MEEETKTEIKEVIKVDKPKNAVDLYMNNRQQIGRVKHSSERYWLTIDGLKLGINLLKEHKELKESIREILKSKKTYPPSRNMDYDEVSKVYNLTGSDTGKIQVLSEQLEIGQQEMLNQQVESLMPYIMEWDNKVYEALLNEGVIQKISMDMEIMKALGEELNG